MIQYHNASKGNDLPRDIQADEVITTVNEAYSIIFGTKRNKVYILWQNSYHGELVKMSAST